MVLRSFWGWVILLSALLSACYHQESVQQKLEQEGLEQTAVGLSREVQSGRYHLMATPELHQRLKADDEWLLVDVRTESSYRRGHIPGATNSTFPKGVVMDETWDLKLMEGKQE